MFNVKQLKISEFIKYICQLIISTSNATLELHSLYPWKSKFLGNNIWINALGLKSKKAQGIFGEIFILALLPSSTKTCFRFLLICFAHDIKGFYKSSLGNEVDFRDIMNVSPNILANNENLKNEDTLL